LHTTLHFINKPTQEGIYQHFKAISSFANSDIIYNVPGRTSSNMLPKTVLRLANDFQNIVAVKEAAGIWSSYAKVKDKPKDFLVISGDDMIVCQWFLLEVQGSYPL
jgi:4-hydroxy-tetrahydrodipicolinate synthase